MQTFFRDFGVDATLKPTLDGNEIPCVTLCGFLCSASPQNTGNIARTCAATGTKLHLVHPLGFDVSEKAIKRAGLDYWDKVEIEEHKSF